MKWHQYVLVTIIALVAESKHFNIGKSFISEERSNENNNKKSDPQSSRNEINSQANSKDMDSKSVLYINIAVHFDYGLTQHLRKYLNATYKNTLKQFASVVIDDIDQIFKDPELKVKIHFNKLDVKFLKPTPQFDARELETYAYLKSYCKWQSLIKMKRNIQYYSVLLTNRQLLDYGYGNPPEYTSHSFRGSICNKQLSCTIVEWNVDRMTFMLGKSIGHSLGMVRDGPPQNFCRPEGIMSVDTASEPRFNNTFFTPCNLRDFRNFISTDKANCLFPK